MTCLSAGRNKYKYNCICICLDIAVTRGSLEFFIGRCRLFAVRCNLESEDQRGHTWPSRVFSGRCRRFALLFGFLSMQAIVVTRGPFEFSVVIMVILIFFPTRATAVIHGRFAFSYGCCRRFAAVCISYFFVFIFFFVR